MYKLHVKIGDFEFVESEYSDSVTREQLAEEYQLLTQAFKPKVGLERLVWNKLLDKYIVTGTMEAHEYESCSDEQKRVIQEIKKSSARINPKKDDNK